MKNFKGKSELTIVLLIGIISVVANMTNALPLFNNAETADKVASPQTKFEDKVKNENLGENISLSDIGYYNGLPVSKVKEYPTEKQSLGTAILILQYHKNPGTQARDSVNDSAEITQNQIYEIIKQLNEESGVKTIVVEGQLAGEVPSSVVEPIKNKIDARDNFTAEYEKLKNELKKESVNSQVEASLMLKIEDKLDETDREIILAGAPLALKANNEDDIILYGPENKETLEKSAAIVKDYIYLQDRLNEIQYAYGSNPIYLNGYIELNTPMENLLKQLLVSASVPHEFGILETEARNQGRYELADQISVCRELFAEMGGNGNSEALSRLIGSGTQAKNANGFDNPYKNVRNPETLNNLLEKSEEQIEKIIIEQRNKEAAENFLAALEESGQTTGIIQFGAGHEEGLIKELNRAGLNVIVITPDEVARRG